MEDGLAGRETEGGDQLRVTAIVQARAAAGLARAVLKEWRQVNSWRAPSEVQDLKLNQKRGCRKEVGDV